MIQHNGPDDPRIGWQPGLDWEVRRTERGHRAELFHRRDLLAVVESRWRPMLVVRMRLAQFRHRRAAR